MKGVKRRENPGLNLRSPIKDKELFFRFVNLFFFLFLFFSPFIRIVSVFEGDSNSTVDSVFNVLCKNHVEYKRKPRNLLQNAIATSLVYLRENQPVDNVPPEELSEVSNVDEDQEVHTQKLNSFLIKLFSAAQI